MKVPFNKPYMTGKELEYIRQAYSNRQLSGNGLFTKKCHEWLKKQIGCSQAFLTHSCTGALEMAALLAELKPGDEVIMPSFTFVSTANAFVMHSGVPVFVDIRRDTLNIDEGKIEAAITPKTKAIAVVHYAGVSCEMDTIMAIAKKHNLLVIEDAAHGLLSHFKGKPLGSLGHLAALSFHETKNIISGEGGALLINEPRFIERARIIWEKGTNRLNFFEGKVDRYTWLDKGSSYLPSELTAAFLWAQAEQAKKITHKRLRIWQRYHDALAGLEQQGWLRRPVIPEQCTHNAHMYYILLPDAQRRKKMLKSLIRQGIDALFHYIPLHRSAGGKKFGRICGKMSVTEDLSERILRLPLWVEMKDKDVDLVVAAIKKGIK